RSVPARDQPRPSHRREREDDLRRARPPAAARAEPHRPRGLRGLGAGAGHLLRRQVGQALPAALLGERPRRGPGPRQHAGRAPRQGALRLHRAGLLPRAAGRRARGLPAVREPARAVTKEDPPPFLGSWRNVYLLVAIELAVLVALFYAFTRWAS